MGTLSRCRCGKACRSRKMGKGSTRAGGPATRRGPQGQWTVESGSRAAVLVFGGGGRCRPAGGAAGVNLARTDCRSRTPSGSRGVGRRCRRPGPKASAAGDPPACGPIDPRPSGGLRGSPGSAPLQQPCKKLAVEHHFEGSRPIGFRCTGPTGSHVSTPGKCCWLRSNTAF